ncbi:right-handed parallel beta-helix repeat-containing protein [Myxococcota bacterium]|nr:right-handed parallel beta-helix repeat-containing protein [Myxococcota bacterium]
MMRRTLLVYAVLLGAGSAYADDGVLEINQSCAVNTGCFAGDTAGFPVTITTAGSYRLTGSLTVPDANTTGIESSANAVTIDLNGFEIAGPVVCPGGGGSCTPASGTGNGIAGTSGTHVRNGVIRGMGARGVAVSAFSIVEDLRLTSNRAQQILVGDGSIVRNNVIERGGSSGVQAADGVVFTGNVVTNHNATGAFLNGPGALVFGNSFYDNAGDGVSATTGAAILENRSYSNNGDGIQTTTSSLVQRNSIYENVGIGLNNISSVAPTAFRNNMIYLNLGVPTANSVDLGGNFCGSINGVFVPCQ